MLKSHLLLALRNVQRHRRFTALNVISLSIGVACCLLILLYVVDEVSYDRFHADADDLYRVNWDVDWQGMSGVGPGTPPPLAAAFEEGIPDIESAIRLYPISRMIVRRGDAFFDEGRIVAADSNLFGFFGFRLLQGDPATALAAPNSVVVTESAARRYFGDASVLGKTLTIGEDRQIFGRYAYASDFEVTGVVEDVPQHSHIQFDMLTSMSSHPEVAHFDWSWVWMQMVTYVRLRDGVSGRDVQPEIADVVRQHGSPFPRIGFYYDDVHEAGGRYDFVLQPMKDIYLGSAEIGNRVGPVGNRTYVIIFATIAGFLLAIACINSMNLATVRATTRAREVGVRKVLGSERRSLVGQFIAESLSFSALAVPCALVLSFVLIQPFNQLTGKSLAPDLIYFPWMAAILFAILLVVGIGAGIYPALYLSSFRPIQALKGAIEPGGRSGLLRRGLVVIQFAITIGVIACALVVQQQMDFIRDADLGFRREGIVVISNDNNRLRGQEQTFRNRIVRHSAILDATVSTGIPPYDGFQDGYTAEGQENEPQSITSYLTDEHFLSTLDLQLSQGRGFSTDHATDTAAVILNEAALAAFGWQGAVGRTIRYPGGNNREYEVIGVMRDFNFGTLRQPVTPFALFHDRSRSYEIADSYVTVRLAAGEVSRGLNLLREEWKAFAPDSPFDYRFLDESLGAQYLSEQRLGRGFLLFSGLMILIACLGLYGLAAFAAEQRIKEIGVRKVLGASVPSIVSLLSKSFVKLVIVAFFVGAPAAYIGMQRWLANFAFHIEIGPGVFLLSGMLALVVALATVSYRGVRAASADPVVSLRYE